MAALYSGDFGGVPNGCSRALTALGDVEVGASVKVLFLVQSASCLAVRSGSGLPFFCMGFCRLQSAADLPDLTA